MESISSREQGPSIDFVGWNISEAEPPRFISIEYSDKQRKFPTIELTRYPVAFSAIPESTIVACVIGRLTELWFNTCGDSTDDDSIAKFVEGARTTFEQIAKRNHSISILEKGITAFMKFTKRGCTSKVAAALRSTAGAICKTSTSRATQALFEKREKFSFSNASQTRSKVFCTGRIFHCMRFRKAYAHLLAN